VAIKKLKRPYIYIRKEKKRKEKVLRHLYATYCRPNATTGCCCT
jgi:hypothetical protein